MTADPIVEEVRCARRAYAESFGFDLGAMAADLRKSEQQHPERVISLPPRQARKQAVRPCSLADTVAENPAAYAKGSMT